MQTQHAKRKVPTRMSMKNNNLIPLLLILLGAFSLFGIIVGSLDLKLHKSAYENIKITTVEPTPTPTVTPSPMPSYVVTTSHMLTLVNEQREEYGLRDLIEIQVLDVSAYLKAQDLQKEYDKAPTRITINHYDSYGRWFTGFFHDAGYYGGAAENLAQVFPTDEATIQGWMASSEHKANILEPKAIYFGYAQVGVFRVAHFGGK